MLHLDAELRRLAGCRAAVGAVLQALVADILDGEFR